MRVTQNVTGSVRGDVAGRDVIHGSVIHVYADQWRSEDPEPSTEELIAWHRHVRTELRRARLRLIFGWPLVGGVVWTLSAGAAILYLLIARGLHDRLGWWLAAVLGMALPSLFFVWRTEQMRRMQGHVFADLSAEAHAAERAVALRMARRN